MRSNAIVLAIVLAIIAPLAAQTENGLNSNGDSVSYIGLSLSELLSRFGVPRSVYPVRGLEEWQDDVVFVYEEGDFYILKDRVWQVGLKSGLGIKTGDTWGTVTLVLGPRAESRYNSIFYSIDEGSWPMMLRCEFGSDGRVRAIFIYRTDL